MSGGFPDLGLMPELLKGIEEMGWALPSDVQDEAIPLIMGGGDVMVAAETGSGKTGAFALPAIQLAHELKRQSLAGGGGSGGGGGGGGSGPAAKPSVTLQVKLSAEDRSPFVAVDDTGMKCQARHERNWGGIRGSIGVLDGAYYYEVSIEDEGLGRFGWASSAASYDLGTDLHGFGFGGTGKKSNNRRFDSYGEPFGLGDTIGCFVDRPNGAIKFTKNGKDLGTAFDISSVKGALYPAICLKNAQVQVNFGQKPFKFTPGGDFKALTDIHRTHAAIPAAAAPSVSPAGGEGPLVLIIEPSKDLADQVAGQFASLTKYVNSPSISHSLVIGGMDMKKLFKDLKRGADIIIGTPGKLWDLVQSKKIDVSNIRLFILDEADKLTDPDNLDIIMKVFNRIPKNPMLPSGVAGRLQVCFFSATLHSDPVVDLSHKICFQPTWVDLKGKDSVPDTVHHVVINVDPKENRQWTGITDAITDGVHARDRVKDGNSDVELSEGIKRLKPHMLVQLIESFNMDQCLIFCRTNLDCDNLAKYLTQLGGGRGYTGKMESGKENPYSCVVVGGFKSSQERKANLKAFKEGDVRFLICTDAIARGIDIKELPYVINMTLPDEPEQYIHRIGRVGRADRMGLAISIVATEKEKVWFHKNCKDRGRNCFNTKLLSQGGCTIWYDEPACLQGVEKRLGASIADMKEEKTGGAVRFVLPEGMDTDVKYGEERGASGKMSEHIMSIQDQVEELGRMEDEAQLSYLTLKQRFQRKQ